MTLLRDAIRSVTFRQSVVTTTSTVLNGLLGAVFYFLLAKLLGSHDYGIFTVGVTTITMLAGIFDLGSDQGLIRFISKYKNNKNAQRKIAKLALKIKIISGGLVFFALLLFGKDITNAILGKPEVDKIIFLVGIGVITQLLFSFSTSFSQALERFFLWGGLFVGTNLIRLLLIVSLFAFGYLNSFSATIIYIVSPFLGFIFSLFFLDRSFLNVDGEISHLRKLLSFNKWTAGFVIITTVSTRIDVYFTTKFLNLESVGVYGLAIQAATIMFQVTSAIEAVISPKFASFTKDRQNRIYTLKTAAFALLLAAGLSILLIPISLIIFRFAGRGYEGAFLPFLLLLGAMAIFLIVTPIRDSIIYFFEKPQFFFWMAVFHLILVTLLSLFLIPKFGIGGASLVVLTGQVFVGISAILYFFVKSRT